MELIVKTSEKTYNLEASVRLMGKDLLVAIWGGDKPHIGAVSVAQPRPSLKNPELTSASASVICMVGHKEDELAKTASQALAASLNTHVVVAAGIHWDDIEPSGIETVIQNSKILVDLIRERVLSEFPVYTKKEG